MLISQFKPFLNMQEYEGIKDCFDLNWITEGPKSKQFMEQLLDLTEAPYGIFAPNGTLGLFLALKAFDIGTNDEVIVPDFTFLGSASSICLTGAKPIFCDVNRKNFQIDLEFAEKLITSKTKAIMPVHIYGTCADMDPIIHFAKKHNLLIIEDAAQSIGIKYKGKHTGTFGNAGVFSFFADKTITTGEGSLIVVKDKSVYEKLLYLRNQGRLERGSFIHPHLGFNFRITDLQAAVGLVQLKKLNQIVEMKLEILNQYQESLKGLDGLGFFEPEVNANYIPFRFCILSDKATELMNFYKKNDIETRTFFYPLHMQPCFQTEEYKQKADIKFVNSVYGFNSGLCLPSYPGLTKKEIQFVCDITKKFYNE